MVLLNTQFTDTEHVVRNTALAYPQERQLARVQQALRNEKTDRAIFRCGSTSSTPRRRS